MASKSIPHGSTGDSSCCFSEPIALEYRSLKNNRKEVFNFNTQWRSTRNKESDISSQNIFNDPENEDVINWVENFSVFLVRKDFSLHCVVKGHLEDLGLVPDVFLDLGIDLVVESWERA